VKLKNVTIGFCKSVQASSLPSTIFIVNNDVQEKTGFLTVLLPLVLFCLVNVGKNVGYRLGN
jgi:hypothetical protein